MRLFLYCFVLLGFVCPAWGTTYTVEKDGSGDYTVIQDAVDAAASGDTVLVGSGRYSDEHIVPDALWSDLVQVIVRQDELTIIGAGIGKTIVGPDEPWDISMNVDRGIAGGPNFGSNNVHVEGISFVNSYSGIISHPPFHLSVRSCSFERTRYSISVGGGRRLLVDGCSFSESMDGGIAVLSLNGSEAHISNCNFCFLPPSPVNIKAIQLEGIPVSSVTNCEFIGGRNATTWIGGQSGIMSNCSLSGQNQYGIISSGSVGTNIKDSILYEQEIGVYIRDSSVQITNTSILGVNDFSIYLWDSGDATVNNCVLSRGPEYVIRQYRNCAKEDNKDLPHLDFTNNDWGTASADSIEAWIKVCDYVIDYIPYVGQPVATEQETWGGVKALYR